MRKASNCKWIASFSNCPLVFGYKKIDEAAEPAAETKAKYLQPEALAKRSNFKVKS